MNGTPESAGIAEPGGSWRRFDAVPLPPVLQAAQDCFGEHGYHGTTIREVAARAGLSVPGIYHHYPSKQALLVGIAQAAMAELYDRTLAAAEEAGADPVDRIRAVVESLVLFHAHRGPSAFIAASEIRSLDGDARAAHIAARDRQQRLLSDAVDDAAAAGRVGTPVPHEAMRAVTTMCTAVAQWYRLDGPLRPEELASTYVRFALDLLRIDGTGPA